jgi:hypothetical protein
MSNQRSLRHRITGALVLSLGAAAFAPAQCGFDWQPGSSWPGPNGAVMALVNAANGDLIAGGWFEVADAAVVHHVARWNGSNWDAVGAGFDGDVNALAVLANGDFVAGGAFTLTGGLPANRIARWNGSTWSPLGAGLDGVVRELLLLPNGDLVAGGAFTTAGGLAAPGVARWDGVSWHAMGAGLPGTVRALARTSNGDVFAGGAFGPDGLARWNGSSWTAIPGVGWDVYQLAVLPNDHVVIGGHFWLHGAIVNLARWDGAQATTFATPVHGAVSALSVAPNGDLVAGGGGTVFTTNVARWSAGTWTALGVGSPESVIVIVHDRAGRVVAGCNPGEVEPLQPAVVRWDGSAWLPLGAAVPAVSVWCAVRTADGSVYVGGWFAGIAGVAANNIARWTGAGWQALGAGVDGYVTALAAASNGDLLVGGEFTAAGGAPARRIARWNGFAWSTVGAGLGDAPQALAATPAGEVFAIPASSYGYPLRRFDGTTWATVPLPAGPVRALAVEPGGSVLVAGSFGPFLGMVRYSAGVLQYLPAPAEITQMLVTSEGTLYAAKLSPDARVMRRDGIGWTTIGQMPAGEPGAYALGELPNGDLVIAGEFAQVSSVPARRLAHWDGSVWRAFAAAPEPGALIAIATTRAGEVVIGGNISWLGGDVHPGFARAAPTCPAAAATFGVGCTGSAGPVALQATNLPWTGGTFRAAATGLPPLALAVHAVGTPLPATPLPLATSNCWWFVAPILLDLVAPAGSTAVATFAVPRTASLVGQLVHTQLVVVERDATLALQRLTSSNALQLTIGGF